jgi:Arc/MetJ-type ribon-helix-helix transcriptional regulator
MLKNRRNIVSLALSEELGDMLLEHWIDNGYASASEYIRELIRNDLRQNGKKPDRQGLPRVRFSDDRFRKPTR